MFDADMHKEYLFLSYLIGLLPEEEEPIDLDGKLKLECLHQKHFEGAQNWKVDGQYVPSKKEGGTGDPTEKHIG